MFDSFISMINAGLSSCLPVDLDKSVPITSTYCMFPMRHCRWNSYPEVGLLASEA